MGAHKNRLCAVEPKLKDKICTGFLWRDVLPFRLFGLYVHPSFFVTADDPFDIFSFIKRHRILPSLRRLTPERLRRGTL